MDSEVMESAEVDTLETSREVATEPDAELFAVKVDGDEEQVSLSELQDGYMRQADYTRKTQELSEQRKRSQQAEAIVSSLESDPEGTLRALGDAFGVAQPKVQQQSMDTNSWTEFEEPEDATSQRIADLESRLEQQDRFTRRQAVEKQVESLKTQYGEFDSQELFQHALRHKIGNLEAALTHMRFGDVADRAAKLEKERDRVDAKRGAGVVEPGGSTAAGSVSVGSAEGPPQSVAEAWHSAKSKLS